MTFLVLHGVNLNMFGQREKAHYGTATLQEINTSLRALAAELGVSIDIFQTNHEGEMIARIHQAAAQACGGVVINAGAWTHYSYALADALAILKCPVIEVHMSNIFRREAFRAVSVLAPVCAGSICGLGVQSYLLGLRGVVRLARDAG